MFGRKGGIHELQGVTDQSKNALVAVTQGTQAASRGFAKMQDRAKAARTNLEYKEVESRHAQGAKAQKKALAGAAPSPLRKAQLLTQLLKDSTLATYDFFGEKAPSELLQDHESDRPSPR